MFRRYWTWWRVLSYVLLSLTALAWPPAAQAAPTSSFSLIQQDPVATLNTHGDGRLSMTVALAAGTLHASVAVAVYPHLVQRSQIAPIFSGTGVSGAPLAITRDVVLDCALTHPATFAIGLFTIRPGRVRSPCFAHAPQLRLGCVGARCDGVYPLRITVHTPISVTTEWSLVTVQTTHVVRPLQVVLVEELSPTTPLNLRSVAALDDLARHSLSPFTLSGNYVALNQLQQSGAANLTVRTALNRALASPLHQIVSAPPGTIDFGGLAASGLADQVNQQLTLSANLVKSVTGRYVDGTILLHGQPTLADLRALARAKVANVVLPETALTVQPSTTLTWGAPFHPGGITSMTALATDEGLSSLVAAPSIEPGRRAAIALGTLAFLHFEAPNALAARTVVITAPLESTSPAFLDALFSGINHNPYLQLASLSPSFNTSLIATNGAPAVRNVINSSAAPAWPSRNVTALTTLVSSTSSYSQAIASAPVADALRVAVAASEVRGSVTNRLNLLANASATLQRQLSFFSVDPSAITLTGPGTSLPITVISRANYPVTAVVHVITDRMSFPKGANVAITLASPTTSLRVPTSNHQGSSLILQVVVTTPDSQVILARAAIQVRIAGTSVVGYLLSFASLLVLALWWWRTYRRRSKGRHAR